MATDVPIARCFIKSGKYQNEKKRCQWPVQVRLRRCKRQNNCGMKVGSRYKGFQHPQLPGSSNPASLAPNISQEIIEQLLSMRETR